MALVGLSDRLVYVPEESAADDDGGDDAYDDAWVADIDAPVTALSVHPVDISVSGGRRRCRRGYRGGSHVWFVDARDGG